MYKVLYIDIFCLHTCTRLPLQGLSINNTYFQCFQDKESVAALFVASHEQPATKHQTAKSFAYWDSQTRSGVPMLMSQSWRPLRRRKRRGCRQHGEGRTKRNDRKRSSCQRHHDHHCLVFLFFLVFSISYGKKHLILQKKYAWIGFRVWYRAGA